VSRRETEYLDALVRGVYASRDLEPDYVFSKESFNDDVYLAVPLLKGQLSCREVMDGLRITEAVRADEALTIDHVDGPYSSTPSLREVILQRGH
jgi:N-acetylneuraminate synthase